MSRLLLVEDEASLISGLTRVLAAQGHQVDVRERGDTGLQQALAESYDLMLLDVGLPGIDGFEVLRRLRERGATMPVIMLTARGEEVDRVLGFQLGVDDYVVKPFSIMELLGRIGAVLRRAAPTQPQLLCFGAVRIDLSRYTVSGARVDTLPTRAFDMLKVLASAEGQVVNRDTLIDKVWGVDVYTSERTVNNLIVKIRQAIEADPDQPLWLKTVHGIGYRLQVSAS